MLILHLARVSPLAILIDCRNDGRVTSVCGDESQDKRQERERKKKMIYDPEKREKKNPATNPQGPACTYICSCRRRTDYSNCRRLRHHCHCYTVAAA
jgi:hypothetical protein